MEKINEKQTINGKDNQKYAFLNVYPLIKNGVNLCDTTNSVDGQIVYSRLSAELLKKVKCGFLNKFMVDAMDSNSSFLENTIELYHNLCDDFYSRFRLYQINNNLDFTETLYSFYLDSEDDEVKNIMPKFINTLNKLKEVPNLKISVVVVSSKSNYLLSEFSARHININIIGLSSNKYLMCTNMKDITWKLTSLGESFNNDFDVEIINAVEKNHHYALGRTLFFDNNFNILEDYPKDMHNLSGCKEFLTDEDCTLYKNQYLVDKQISKQDDDPRIFYGKNFLSNSWIIMCKHRGRDNFLMFGKDLWVTNEDHAQTVLLALTSQYDSTTEDTIRFCKIKIKKDDIIDLDKPEEFAKTHNF